MIAIVYVLCNVCTRHKHAKKKHIELRKILKINFPL